MKLNKILGLYDGEEHLNVVDYHTHPGLRYRSISDYSAEDFYITHLRESFYNAITENKKLVLSLDYVAGYAPCFIDEIIGRLVYDFTLRKVKRYLKVISDEEPCWIDMIKNETYSKWETKRKEKV